MGSGCGPNCSASHPPPSLWPGKAEEDGSGPWSLASMCEKTGRLTAEWRRQSDLEDKKTEIAQSAQERGHTVKVDRPSETCSTKAKRLPEGTESRGQD